MLMPLNPINIIFWFLLFTTSAYTQKVKKIPVQEKHHGISIVDDYRHLENLKDSSVLNWLKTQDSIAKDVLKKISNRDRLVNLQIELANLDGEEINQIKVTQANRVFYLKRDAGNEQFKLYYCNAETEEILLFDPEDYKPELNQKYYINYINPSWNGDKVIISFAKNGDEFSEIRILDLNQKKLLPIEINNSIPTFINMYWLPDDTGITYLGFPKDKGGKEAYLNGKAVMHKLNGDIKEIFSKNNNPEIDIKEEDLPALVIENPNDKFIVSAVAGATPYHDYYFKPISEIESETSWTPLFSKEDQVTSFYQKNDSIFYLTSNGASNFKICKTSLQELNTRNPQIVVDEDKNEVITSFRLIKEGIVYTTTKNGVQAKLYIVKNNNKTEEIKLPFAAGRLVIYTKGREQDYLSIKIRGWLNKERRFKYNFSNNRFIPEDFIEYQENEFTEEMVVEELEVMSNDSLKIPLSLIYKKDLIRNSNNPTFIIAYGAYGVSIEPMNTAKVMSWVHEGGIFAIAHVRGGGEKGDSWYKGGYKNTKPNSWKDLIACTDFMIDKKYTSSEKIAVNGASAGGITVGRAITERPDLFSAAIINVGFMNTVRIENGLNGENNAKEFGTVEIEEEFKSLLEMDSYHHLKENTQYPATLITTGLNDSRVPPWHSAKFVAKIQDSQKDSIDPILFKVNFESGHGSGNSKTERIESTADILSFAFWRTGHPNYKLKN